MDDNDFVPDKLVPPEWHCEVCYEDRLAWGYVFGSCYCVNCGAPHKVEIIDGRYEVVSKIKPGWLGAVRLCWSKHNTNVMEMDDSLLRKYKKELK